MANSKLPLLQLHSVESTNNYAAKLIDNGNASQGTAIMAQFQTRGRGRRGASWESIKGLNLLASIIVFPGKLPIAESFVLNKISCVAVADHLTELGLAETGLKWPNDVLVAEYKICGILTETRAAKNYVKAAIIGVGLNVGQIEFNDNLKATSIEFEGGNAISVREHLEEIQKRVVNWLSITENKGRDKLNRRYLSYLNGYGRPVLTRTPEGLSRIGSIDQVCDDGRVAIDFQDEPAVEVFSMDEIKIVI